MLGICSGIVYNSASGSTSCLCRTSRWTRDEILGPSQSFSGHVHSSMHMQGLLDSQDYFEAFQSSLGTRCSQRFFKIFWSTFCLPQLLSLLQASMMLSCCCWLFSINIPGANLFWLGNVLGQIKTNPQIGFSREWPDRSNNDSSEKGTLKKSFGPLQCLLVSTIIVGLVVFKATTEMGERGGNKAS